MVSFSPFFVLFLPTLVSSVTLLILKIVWHSCFHLSFSSYVFRLTVFSSAVSPSPPQPSHVPFQSQRIYSGGVEGQNYYRVNKMGRYVDSSHFTTPSLHNFHGPPPPSPHRLDAKETSSAYFDQRVALTRSGRIKERIQLAGEQQATGSIGTVHRNSRTIRKGERRHSISEVDRPLSYSQLHDKGEGRAGESIMLSTEERIFGTSANDRRRLQSVSTSRPKSAGRDESRIKEAAESERQLMSVKEIRRQQRRDKEVAREKARRMEQATKYASSIATAIQAESERRAAPQWTGDRHVVPSKRLSKGSKARRRAQEDLLLLESSGFSLSLSR